MKDLIKIPDISIESYLRLLPEDPEKLLFFDIETTGLSPHSSSLYLIGMLYFRDGGPVFRQLFAENMGEELTILKLFFAFSEGFEVLVHFNGDTFDLPYLESCGEQYSLPSPLRKAESMDILRLVRKEKKLLGLESCRQKAVEEFLRLEREDRYDGGTLIQVYQAYEKDRDPEKERLLLLHNEEDVCHMPELLPVLAYSLPSLRTEPFPFSVTENYTAKSGERRYLCLTFPYRFPRELRTETDTGIQVRYQENTILLSVPQYCGELKYYYPNYRDYCYLPKEDRAVHKKLARYVEKPYREPATADTCYTRICGAFLPALPDFGSPVFSEARSSARKWHLIREDSDFCADYCLHLLRSFCS